MAPTESKRQGNTLYRLIVELLDDRMEYEKLYRAIADHIPPSEALRKQKADAYGAWQRRPRRVPLDSDSQYRPKSIPLEGRIETGRRAIFRKKIHDMTVYHTLLLVDIDGIRYVERR